MEMDFFRELNLNPELNKVKRRSTKMEVKELNLEELQHEHPLTLVDLQLMHRDYVEDDDDYDENDLIAMQNFECTCDRCNRRIDWYHRYYYKCSMSSCNYSIHKFCEEIPTTLKFQGHPSHNLILIKTTNDQKCRGCLRSYQDGICYHCSTCNYGIDLLCATFVEQNTIHHPSHPHPLICVCVEPGLNKCFACEKKHEGRFYQCTTCFNFLINSDCLSLPIKLSLETEQFSHHHLLTLSYSFKDQLYDFECRICGKKFEDEHLIYKCSKCMYYVHPDCATQRIEHFMSIMLPGLGKTGKNFKDVDHPSLVPLPLVDESHSILSHIVEWESCDDEQVIRDKNSHLPIHHESHEHPLVLINNNTTSSSSSSMMFIKLHDPMKRIRVLCDGCSRPITNMPFYKCSKHDEYGCDFVLHDCCATRLPKEIRNHVGHQPEHTLELLTIPYTKGFECRICELPNSGFSYSCSSCNYMIDVNCAFIPKEITHEAHTNHLLTRVDHASSSRRLAGNIECRACRVSIDESKIYFRCGACDFYLDCRCALHLPKTIRHKLDKHRLELSYGPVEDHKSEYFCEVCEEGLDPGKWFYHCVECAQSIHTACAPLILQSEQNVNSRYDFIGVYKFINIKFGRVSKTHAHPHPLSLAFGTENDGSCNFCNKVLKSNVIWKCSTCKYGGHYNCRELYLPNGLMLQLLDLWAKDMTKQPKTTIEFYPSEMIRPVTRHWKVVEM